MRFSKNWASSSLLTLSFHLKAAEMGSLAGGGGSSSILGDGDGLLQTA